MFSKYNYRIFFLLLFITVSSFTFVPYGDTNSWIKGTWQGTGVQIDGPNQVHSWSIVFYANPAKNSYTVQYPSIPCKGTWKLVKIDKSKAEFIESVEEKDKCYDNGYIIITAVNRKHISFSWFREKSSKVMAYSTLIKVE